MHLFTSDKEKRQGHLLTLPQPKMKNLEILKMDASYLNVP
jgi:hypothetical protein